MISHVSFHAEHCNIMKFDEMRGVLAILLDAGPKTFPSER